METYFNTRSLSDRFVNCVSRIARMVEHFSPAMIDDYTAAKKEAIETAVELVKAGCQFHNDENKVIIEINGQTFELEVKDIKDVIGDEYEAVFIKPEPEESVDEDKYGYSCDGYSETEDLLSRSIRHIVQESLKPYANMMKKLDNDVSEMKTNTVTGMLMTRIYILEKERDEAVEAKKAIECEVGKERLKLVEKNDEVERYIEEAKRAKEEVQEELQMCYDEIDRLEGQLKIQGRSDEEYDELIQEKRELEERVRGLNIKIRDQEYEVEKAKSSAERMSESLSLMNADMEARAQEYNSLRLEYDDFKERSESESLELKKKIDELTDENENVVKTIREEHEQAIRELSERYEAKKTEEMDALREELEAEKESSLNELRMDLEDEKRNLVKKIKEDAEVEKEGSLNILKEQMEADNRLALKTLSERLEQEKKSAVQNAVQNAEQNSKSRLDDVKNEAERRCKKEYDRKLAAKESEFEQAQEENNEKIKRLERQVESIKREKDGLSERFEQYKKDNEGKIRDLQKEVAKSGDYKRDSEESSQKLKDAEAKVRSLQEECDRLNIKLKEAENNHEEADKVKSEHEEYVVKMHGEMEDLRKLAYFDNKTETLNLNAFNRDFIKADKDNTLLIMVNIGGMRQLNASNGRAAGDILIHYVAKGLIDEFGEDKVYRMFGDQFGILITDDKYKSILNRMIAIQRNFAENQASIFFGIADGSRCESKQSMLNMAEAYMDKARAKATADNKAEEPTNTDMGEISVEEVDSDDTEDSVGESEEDDDDDITVDLNEDEDEDDSDNEEDDNDSEDEEPDFEEVSIDDDDNEEDDDDDEIEYEDADDEDFDDEDDDED